MKINSYFELRYYKFYLLKLLLIFFICELKAFDPKSVPLVGVGAGGIAYYTSPLFANAAYMEERNWQLVGNGNFQYSLVNPDQFDVNGYPKYLLPGQKLYIQPGQNMGYNSNGNRGTPFPYPRRNRTFEGLVCITWEGNADIRLIGATFVSSLSGSVLSTGSYLDGKRYYRVGIGSNPNGYTVQIEALSSVTGLKKLRVWMPDPSDPNNKTLEPAFGQPERLLHPLYEKVLEPFEEIRFMDWLNTNTSPQQDWKDRRRPTHCFMQGVINKRSPAPGFYFNVGWSPRNVTVAGVINSNVQVRSDVYYTLNTTTAGFVVSALGTLIPTTFTGRIVSQTPISGGIVINYTDYLDEFEGNRGAGVSFETIIQLANSLNKNIWINVPHLATDDYITKMAQVFKYGSDGNMPYTSPQANPIYPPLKPNIKVFLEYSNEIWSFGSNFSQGEWATVQGFKQGLSGNNFIEAKARFNAQRASQIFSKWQEVFDDPDRIINVASAFTGNTDYTRRYLQEMKNYGLTLNPAVKGDVLAVTTYFGQDIQFWIRDKGQAWFSNHSEENINAALDEFKLRMISGQASTNNFDANDIGGFGVQNKNLAKEFGLELLSYEGGPSLYTDSFDNPDNPQNVDVTIMVEKLNRHPRFADIYNIHLNQARSLGLRMHDAFVDISGWGKYGQWGHLEYLDQKLEKSGPSSYETTYGWSVKYQFLKDFVEENKNINHINDSIGTRPKYVSSPELPIGKENRYYDYTISITGGEGLIQNKIVSAITCPGITFDENDLRFTGTPTQSGVYYYVLRMVDSDGDPDYRTFTLRVLPKPQNKLFAYDDFGTSIVSLQGLNSGIFVPNTTIVSGFSNSWDVQGGNANGGFDIVNIPASTGYLNLNSSSNYQARIGRSYQTAGRDLKLTDFDYLVPSTKKNTIGQVQSQFWASMLVTRTSSYNSNYLINFRESGFYIASREYKFNIGVDGSERWNLSINETNSRACGGGGSEPSCTNVSTNKVAKLNTPELLVVALKFGINNDTLLFFVNPTCLGSSIEPNNPDIKFVTNGLKKLDFNGISLYGFQDGRVLFDDLRMGDTYKAITPSLDVTPPTNPSNLIGSNSTASSVQLSWNAPTDNVGVFGYDVYDNNSVLLGSTSSTNITLTGLVPGRNYSITVKARDCADNISTASNIFNFNTTTDNVPPSNPSNLVQTGVSGGSVNLSWNASSDNIALLGYVVYRDNLSIITTSGTSFNVGGLQQLQTYKFYVRALDLAGNLSLLTTNTITSRTLDVSPPSTPTSISGIVLNETTIRISWANSIDNGTVTGYRIFRNGTFVGTALSNSFTATGFVLGINEQFRIRAIDQAGNLSSNSDIFIIGTPDQTPPSIPQNITISGVLPNAAVVKWDSANDNVNLLGYDVFINTTFIGFTSQTSYSITGLNSFVNYTANIRARDASGNLSSFGSFNFTTPDLTAPSVPINLQVSQVGQTSLRLNWNASNDNISVGGYNVFVNGNSLGSVQQTIFTIVGLSPSTIYTLQVSAYDISGNISAPSTVLSALTQADNIRPSDVVNLSLVSISGIYAYIRWEAASDNYSVLGYNIYINDVFYKSVSGTNTEVISPEELTNYTVRVKAFDFGNNISVNFSNAVGFVSPDITPPGVPTNLVVSTINNIATIQWNSSNENSPSVNYIVLNNNIAFATVTGTQYSFVGLTNYLTNKMSVIAVDDAGNRSGEISITTIFGPNFKPLAPINLIVLERTESIIKILWEKSTLPHSVKFYEVYEGGNIIDTTSNLYFEFPVNNNKIQYFFTVKAIDKAFQASNFSDTLITNNLDNQAPVLDGNVSSSFITSTAIGVFWPTATDNIAVKEYEVFVDLNSYAKTNSTNISISGLNLGVEYYISVIAYDYEGNSSNQIGTLFTTQVTSINQNGFDNLVSIFPNPSSSSVNIVIQNIDENKLELSISDLNGVSVFKGDINMNQYSNYKIEKEIPSGIYYLSLKGDKTNIIKKLVIK